MIIAILSSMLALKKQYVSCSIKQWFPLPEGKTDMYLYMLKVTNWHGLKCVEVKDMYWDMARWHSRWKLQAPTHALKVKDLIKD